MSKNGDTFRRTLAYLADIARTEGNGAEWQAACKSMAAFEIVPPSDMVAPAMLPEAGAPVQRAAALNCATFIMHTLRLRAAERALAECKPYYPSAVARHKASGWAEDEIHSTYADAETFRAAFMRDQRKGK